MLVVVWTMQRVVSGGTKLLYRNVGHPIILRAWRQPSIFSRIFALRLFILGFLIGVCALQMQAALPEFAAVYVAASGLAIAMCAWLFGQRLQIAPKY